MRVRHIFKRTGTAWAEQAKLMASDAAADDWFGQTVYIKDEYAIVGATGEDTVAGDAGAAYIFKRSGTTWTEVKKITASDAEAYDSFGSSVAIDGTTAVVGAGTKIRVEQMQVWYTYSKRSNPTTFPNLRR